MLSRTVVVALLPFLPLVNTVSVSNAQTSSLAANPDLASVCHVGGKILSIDGRPVSGVHVELDDAATAIPIASTATEGDGSFELYNIPKGNYELVAESDDHQIDNVITVTAQERPIELRFLKQATAPAEAPSTISVAQMLVPGKAQDYYDKAQQAFAKGQLDKSMALVDAALTIEMQFAKALTLRGVIELQKSDLQSAQRDLERAVNIDPSYASIYPALGAIYNHEGRFDDAMRVSERGVGVSPKSWQSYFEMAKASIAKGMYQKGLQFARQAQRLSGNSFAAAHLVRAYALVPLKLYKDAKYELQAFLSREPNGSGAKQAQLLLAQIDAAVPATATTAGVH